MYLVTYYGALKSALGALTVSYLALAEFRGYRFTERDERLPSEIDDVLESVHWLKFCCGRIFIIRQSEDIISSFTMTDGRRLMARCLERFYEFVIEAERSITQADAFFIKVTRPPVTLEGYSAQSWHGIVIKLARQLLDAICHNADTWIVRPSDSPSDVWGEPKAYKIIKNWEAVCTALAKVSIPNCDVLEEQLKAERALLLAELASDQPKNGDESTGINHDLQPGIKSAHCEIESVIETQVGLSWYTQQEIADYVQVTPRTVYNWLTGRTKKLVIHREIGNQYLLSHADLEKKKVAEAAKKARARKRRKPSN